MLVFFNDEFPSLLPPLSAAVGDEDARNLHDAAHKAKSAASSAGAVPLAALLAGIEADAGSGEWSDLGTRVAAVVEEYARLEAFCRNENDGN